MFWSDVPDVWQAVRPFLPDALQRYLATWERDGLVAGEPTVSAAHACTAAASVPAQSDIGVLGLPLAFCRRRLNWAARAAQRLQACLLRPFSSLPARPAWVGGGWSGGGGALQWTKFAVPAAAASQQQLLAARTLQPLPGAMPVNHEAAAPAHSVQLWRLENWRGGRCPAASSVRALRDSLRWTLRRQLRQRCSGLSGLQRCCPWPLGERASAFSAGCSA